MERTVELVCLNHNKVAMVREDIISAIVLGNTTKEGVTVQMTLVHKVCTHTGSRCLSMCSSKAKTLMCSGECAENLCTFLNLKAILAEVNQFSMLRRDGRCVDYQR